MGAHGIPVPGPIVADYRHIGAGRERLKRPYAEAVDEDLNRLRLFAATAARAINRRAIRDGTIRAGVKLRFDEAGGEVERDVGDEEDVRSLMLEVRQFVSDGEQLHYPAIANILERRLDDDELHAANRENRVRWKQAVVGQMGFSFNGTSFDALGLFRLYIYGGIFHSDAEKVKTWQLLAEPSQSLALVTINRFLVDVLRVVHATGNIIEKAFTEVSWRDL